MDDLFPSPYVTTATDDFVTVSICRWSSAIVTCELRCTYFIRI